MNNKYKKSINTVLGSPKGLISIVSLVCVLLVNNLQAQQLDRIGKKEPLKVSGGIGVNQSLYFSDGVENRYNPYNYVISGNVAFSMYGISVPLSFAFSNQNFTYSRQPFNIIGASPTYKSLTMHVGYRNMNFSQYTLAGHTFLGGGLEWSKDGFSIASMGGRLLRASEFDSTRIDNRPAYNRYAGGVKLGYTKNGSDITFIAFYAKDDERSILPVPMNINVNPEENSVYSLALRRSLDKHISVFVEGALSGWTRDVRDSLRSDRQFYQYAYPITLRQSTVFYTAFKTGIDFSGEKFRWGVAYERVDPEYRTLGAYFINNDFENITLNAATDFLKKKLSVSGNVGIQHDDLKKEKITRMRRFVGAMNANYNHSERLNMNVSYSNFNSFTTVQPVDQVFLQNTLYDRIDTMNFVQLTQSFNGGVNYKLLDNDRISHDINSNAGYQVANNRQGNLNFGNKMMNAMAGYNVNWKSSGISCGANLNSNINYYDEGEALFAGIGLRASVPAFNKKLRVSINSNLSNNYEQGDLKAMLYVITNSYSFKAGKKHAFNTNLRYSGRKRMADATLGTYNTTFNEFMATLGYSYAF